MNIDTTVEELQNWIDRASSQYDEGWQFHAWDKEYAVDTLNTMLPGLGDYVSLLHVDQALGTAAFYRRSLIGLLNIFKMIDVRSEEDKQLHTEVVSTFERVLGVGNATSF